MAEAVVSIALQTLQDLLLEEVKFLYGVSHQVKDLQKQLKEIKCLLEDADKRQHESKSVCNWIMEIRHLSHRAEDVIETYVVEVCSDHRGKFMRQFLVRFSCITNLLRGSSLHKIGSKISNIKSEIARVNKSMQDYGIRSIIEGETSNASSSNPNQRWKRQTYPVEIEDCFVGRENELNQLVPLMIDDKEHRVISVWGMGGIGKTTIARKLYNHIAIKHCFECFAWVSITQQCNIRLALEDVLKQLTQHKHEDVLNMSDVELIQELCRIQKAKRCMVVLDDLWEIDHWEGLKNAFLVEGLRNKILLTTRKKNVADVVFAFEVGLLQIDDGLNLLLKKAFPHNNRIPVDIKSHQNIGKEIVRKCGSLPLVISLLGGVLSKKKSIEEWESVNRNINRHLYRANGLEKDDKIHGVLNLSYEDLPYCLKPCFLYMGQYREDQTIYVSSLCRLWIAEGMISHGQNHGDSETLMDVAELYLKELVSRSIVQVEVEDFLSTENRYVTCRLHDVVRELCLSKAEEEDFGLQIIEDYRSRNFSTMLGPKTRHLAIHCHKVDAELEDGFTGTSDIDSTTCVRSLQFLNFTDKEKIEFPHSILDFHSFKLLRALVITGCSFKGRKLPRRISNLVHLKYLGLFYCALDELPPSIGNLRYLYTLDLLGSWDVRVPNVLKNMHRLKHLVLPYYKKENIGEYRLGLEGLEEVEILYGFNSLVHDLKSVTKMKNLQYFEAIAHDNQSVSSIIDAITTNWKKLRFCKLVIRRDCEFTSTEEGLAFFQKVFMCPDLHYLWIHVHIGNLIHQCQSEIIGSKIVRLRLMECEIKDDPMEILGKLPSLQQLFFLNRSYVGNELKCHASGFPCLKNLVLKCLPNLREWRVEKGAMPLLSELEIIRCPRLKMVPYGLKFIDTLQTLKISGMHRFGKRVLAPSDGAEGEDFHKVRHVTSIIIAD